jgi:hypothetical protein
MEKATATWEDEGGSPPSAAAERRNGPLYGTESQIEWAEAIRIRIDEEFDRMSSSFRSLAGKQSGLKRANTEAIIAMIEEKREEVLAIDQAGSWIRDWREPGDRVRRMILDDPRYLAIRASRDETEPADSVAPDDPKAEV